ncbi:PepSY-like domain-containing protein [Compostibacter hankyongensis]|uniref:Putative beta-lactamase-inhibitor-like PepSY-like domain-containing protein n=1 Tax=Compostibacter hankyongensis TaxID=1007089 RepID=A0ABP8FTW3_9BACT
MKQLFYLSLLFVTGLFAAGRATAQLRQLPEAVKDAFEQKYPQARKVQYEDRVVDVLVHFENDGAAATAKYNSRGAWQWTETTLAFEDLPAGVQDGFNKSKYASWQQDNVYRVDLPGGTLQYKLQVEKNAVQKKNLYYSTRGRLLSDKITMY